MALRWAENGKRHGEVSFFLMNCQRQSLEISLLTRYAFVFEKEPEFFGVFVRLHRVVLAVGALEHQKFAKQLVSVCDAFITLTLGEFFLGGRSDSWDLSDVAGDRFRAECLHRGVRHLGLAGVVYFFFGHLD